jgi:hypothetical protein
MQKSILNDEGVAAAAPFEHVHIILDFIHMSVR